MPADDRIDRFEKLVALDPDDATSHYTLGTAYAEAGRHEEAAESFLNAIAIDAEFSKAFQLAGRSLIAVGQEDRAKKVLRQGHRVATAKGDMMPARSIAQMLEELGEPVESAPTPAQPAEAEGTPMQRPPFKGPVGEWIQQHISQQKWDAWLGQGTKIINELRLDLSSDEGGKIYDFGMLLYVGLDHATYRELTGHEPPEIDPEYRELLGRILNADPETLAEFKGNVKEIHGTG